ncbi:ParB/RepB/Spo0J family partition protein [Parapedobacter tibetensis]|uniref:ParB/RepB/Spo0J family partition protein n=1 Tax=Parapedobacter tibetensis TaxID=2972951 RepID=UPI00214DA1D3|nr:ParB/RepB/Spo0J family partition protein [Parapedobacter tibetensis]
MKPRAERIEYIRRVTKVAEEDNSNKNYYAIKSWRDKPLHRKIVHIDSEYLMFRIENSRTEIQQLAYIRKNSLGKEFFNDPESPVVQQTQQEILTEMVKGKGRDLLDDLKTRRQEDPCIITYDGYIVNGNRRTAGLKHLGVRYIDCVVLPEDASPKDIYLLEQLLQIAQDFREDYHWINELRNIRKGKEDSRLELTDKELAENLRLSTQELKIKLRMIDLIDAFLIWRNFPGEYDYSKLDDTEEIFRQLEKSSRLYIKDNIKQEALRNAIFTIIEERPSKGRLYGYVIDLIRTFDQVYEKMLQTVSTDPPNHEETKESNPNAEELLDNLIDNDQGSTNFSFDSQENVLENSSKIIEAILDVKEVNKERKDAEAVYESVSAALRELQGLVIDNDTAKLGSVRNKLEQIITNAERLLRELKEYDE